MKKNISIIGGLACLALIIIACITSCGGNSSNENKETKETATVENQNKPLNISIYLDLSDRLTRDLTPSQAERDIEIVNYISEMIKNHAVAQKILPSRDRIKIFFYPSPNDSKIALLSKDLEMDLGQAKPAEKKQMLLEFQDKFKTSLTEIYQSTLQNQNWVGSDIWGFFRKQVDTYCIKNDARNIIVILTDGYIYHENNKQQDGNNFSFVLPKTLSNPNSGLIVSRNGLEDLEVLMLEVNPYTPKDETKLESVLTNWFEGMGVQKLYIGETDQPSNTRLIIDKFMEE